MLDHLDTLAGRHLQTAVMSLVRKLSLFSLLAFRYAPSSSSVEYRPFMKPVFLITLKDEQVHTSKPGLDNLQELLGFRSHLFDNVLDELQRRTVEQLLGQRRRTYDPAQSVLGFFDDRSTDFHFLTHFRSLADGGRNKMIKLSSILRFFSCSRPLNLKASQQLRR